MQLTLNTLIDQLTRIRDKYDAGEALVEILYEEDIDLGEEIITTQVILRMNTLEQRCLNYMKSHKAPREELFQHLWDSTVCPKELAQKALNHAGIPFEEVWNLHARIAHNPYTEKYEPSVDWLTVAYYLEHNHVITLRNTAEAKDRVKQYLNSIP